MSTLDEKNGMSGQSYSVPRESEKLFREGVLRNPLIAKSLPAGIEKFADKVKYVGSEKPSIPINWRFAESTSALKGLEATVLNALLVKKYGIEPQEVVINTDHAQLFIMSTLIWTIDPTGEKIPGMSPKSEKYFPSFDIHRQASTHHRNSATNIYKTKDGRYFHLHGSMNPDPSLNSIGLPLELDASSVEESWKPFTEKIGQINSQEMQRLASDVYKQAGTICWTKEEYLNSEHGKANAHVGLYEIHSHPNPAQRSGWWTDAPLTGIKRPLAGLKVLDITRVIAAPAIGRGLAEIGASVMRVTAPHLVDYSSLHCDLNWGKWNTFLDFRKEEDREKMRKFVLEADVVISGYRPGVLDKWGFGLEGILKICEGRGRGVVYARENCYGWNGPWRDRSGWQQISDANCGVSMEFGRAMGNDEAVTPVFPNSDYCTSIGGVTGILTALMRQAEDGGSYTIDVALNYYSQWLINSCGTYPEEIWQDVWNRNGRQVFRHYHNMTYTLPRYMKMLLENSSTTVLNPEWFHTIESKAAGAKIRCVKPILQFPGNKVQLGFNVGTRTNGVDQPRWPHDLMVEIVTKDN
ncbi:alpha-methylacyl-CoA racemase [Mollisia scopiformis]|uniref:Alpha-methylacyl-CoA racemase n=1 Tax=Mollisia scopiformis TaxID=149040 RepID=A0A132B7A3_MOLSC|nr:alpha-methylacyl-CoA racemase [Mollisia scopiformis]KUJ08286.1 alpha-methylacyl-CoA racemase [Mollisia scopiformis]